MVFEYLSVYLSVVCMHNNCLSIYLSFAFMCVQMHVLIHECTDEFAGRIDTHVCVYAHHMYVYMCIHVKLHMCIYIQIILQLPDVRSHTPSILIHTYMHRTNTYSTVPFMVGVSSTSRSFNTSKVAVVKDNRGR